MNNTASKLVGGQKYKAKAAGWAIRQTNAGDPMVSICFDVSDTDGTVHQVYWNGSFKDGARKFTIETLLVCGLKGNDPSILASGAAGKGLDANKEVQVTIEFEENPQDGKLYPRVKWVNEAGGARFKNAMDEKEAVLKMKGLNLAADVAQIRNEKGYKDTPRTPAPTPAAAPTANLDDIPF